MRQSRYKLCVTGLTEMFWLCWSIKTYVLYGWGMLLVIRRISLYIFDLWRCNTPGWPYMMPNKCWELQRRPFTCAHRDHMHAYEYACVCVCVCVRACMRVKLSMITLAVMCVCVCVCEVEHDYTSSHMCHTVAVKACQDVVHESENSITTQTHTLHTHSVPLERWK